MNQCALKLIKNTYMVNPMVDEIGSSKQKKEDEGEQA